MGARFWLPLSAACLLVSGCGTTASVEQPSAAARHDVAQRFAQAIVRGNGTAAVSLLVNPDDAALSWIARRAASPWNARHGEVRLPGERSGRGWTFGFAGTHTHTDGRFERVRGHIVVVVAASRKGAGVESFAFRNENVRFSTHHDSLLLPSRR